jgi:hypothetical protein
MRFWSDEILPDPLAQMIECCGPYLFGKKAIEDSFVVFVSSSKKKHL